MITTLNFPAVDTMQLDAVLASALALSWDDLMPEDLRSNSHRISRRPSRAGGVHESVGIH